MCTYVCQCGFSFKFSLLVHVEDIVILHESVHSVSVFLFLFQELEDLFARLDMDHDGYISFDEFVSGLSQYLTSPDFETPTMTPFPRPLHVKKKRPPPPPAHLNQNDLFLYTNGETISLFSLLESSNTGCV